MQNVFSAKSNKADNKTKQQAKNMDGSQEQISENNLSMQFEVDNDEDPKFMLNSIAIDLQHTIKNFQKKRAPSVVEFKSKRERIYEKPWVQKKGKDTENKQNQIKNESKAFAKKKNSLMPSNNQMNRLRVQKMNSEAISHRSQISSRSGISAIQRNRKQKIDFNERNRKDLEKMKHRKVHGQYTVFLNSCKNMNMFKAEIENEFNSEIENLETGSNRTNVEIEITDRFLVNSLTLRENTDFLKIYQSFNNFLYEFEIQSFEKSSKTFKTALAAFSNSLKIFYVPRNKLIKYSQTYANVINQNGKRFENGKEINIKDKLEKLNSKTKGNTVSIELLNGDLKVQEITDKILSEEPNLESELEAIRNSEDYLEGIEEGRKEFVQLNGLSKIRINIATNFGMKKKPMNLFGFKRLGLAEYDSLNVIQKNIDQLDKSKDANTIDFQVGIEPYVGVDMKIGTQPAFDLLIYMLSVPISSTDEITLKKIELINNINELVISKNLFSEYFFIGYTHSNQEALYKPSIENNKPVLEYSKMFKNLNKYTKHIVDKDRINNECEEINNVLITEELMGERDESKDLESGDHLFLAFKNKENYRFVYTSINSNSLKKESIFEVWKTVHPQQNSFSCSYHNDNYFTGINLDEIYLISFYATEEELENMKFRKVKKESKAQKQTKENENIVKPKGKINASDLFKKRLLI